MSSTGQPPRAADRCAWRAALVGYLIVNRWNVGGNQAMAHLLLNSARRHLTREAA
ncbi:hypothetical protein [Paraburkholderia sp. UCT31]|uniref:hypothetical protein n=1 Tax=unclassified Paraburkholderia TaxID=2615204 RepID=UPI0016563F1A|nr:hypothetical protein [Paraburkholderia sp. UCT31]